MTDPQAIDARNSTDPIRPVSGAWLLGFAAAWFGFWLLVMLPGQFMVVKLASVLSPEHKVGVSSFLIAEIAVVILVGIPLIGALSDRTNLAFGRRRSWALAGFFVAGIPFALVGLQTSVVVVAGLIFLVAVGKAMILVSLSAMIADQVPVNQRGRASAAMGIPQVIALAGGMVLVTELVTGIGASWAAVAGIAMLTPLPFLLLAKEPPLPPVTKDEKLPPFRPADPKYRDFNWAVVSRVLINAGNLVGTTYLLYFLADELHMPDPDGALMILVLIYLATSGIATWFGGWISDRVHIRRIFVAIAGALQAAAALCLAFVPTWNSAIVAAMLLGAGFGMFLSVDQALVTDTLPNPRSRARDLGILNSAHHVPIAPVVGWIVLGIAGFTELYLVAALIMIGGSLAVYRIKHVR